MFEWINMYDKSGYLSLELPRDELNRNLGGGIPKSSLVLIEGTDGSGKSVIAQRICYSLLQNKHSVTYISTELNTKGFVEQMKSLGYDVKFNLIEGSLLFIPMFPFIGSTKLADNFLDNLLDSKKLFKSDAIIIDTLSFLMVNDELKLSKCFDILNHLKKYTTMNKTIFFCIDPDHINKKLLTLLRSVADIFFSIELKDFAGGLVRVIMTHRFKRPMDSIIPAIPFKVEPQSGLAIEIASFD